MLVTCTLYINVVHGILYDIIASTDNSTMEGLDNLISQIQSIVKAPSRSSEGMR